MSKCKYCKAKIDDIIEIKVKTHPNLYIAIKDFSDKDLGFSSKNGVIKFMLAEDAISNADGNMKLKVKVISNTMKCESEDNCN